MRVVIEQTWDGTPVEAEERVALELRWEPHHLRVLVDAPFHGDPPPLPPPGATDRLWEHEGVELFLLQDRREGPPRYLEVELGPHGHHLVLQLEGVRQVVRSGLPLRYFAARAPGRVRWRGDARIPRSYLPPPPHRLNAYAIHGVGARRRYLALHPGDPGPRPDFHRLASFEMVRWAGPLTPLPGTRSWWSTGDEGGDRS